MDNNILKSFTIDELVNELSTREGVEIDRLRSDVGMDLEVEGPAIVIVIDKEGEYIATLIMRAEAGSGMLRLFFRLVNGNKIITPVFWWQKYLGFYDIDNGTKLKLIYEKNTKGIYLKAVEILS